MPLLKMKEGNTTVHVAGLGVFTPGEWTQVTKEQIKAYEEHEYTVVTRKESDEEKGVFEETETVKKRKVSDLFESKADPVEKDDTTEDKGGKK